MRTATVATATADIARPKPARNSAAGSHRLADESEKVRENRLRRMARRQGLALLKSRARDEKSLTYGCYALVDERTRFLVNVEDPLGRGFPFGYLDDVELWLS